MTKKDFELIAKEIRAHVDWTRNYFANDHIGEEKLRTLSALVTRFELAFADINPRFDAKKFRAACGF